MLRERFQEVHQFLLDGFPHTGEQALTDLLAGRGHLAAVVLKAPDDVVIQRIASRDDIAQTESDAACRSLIDP